MRLWSSPGPRGRRTGESTRESARSPSRGVVRTQAASARGMPPATGTRSPVIRSDTAVVVLLARRWSTWWSGRCTPARLGVTTTPRSGPPAAADRAVWRARSAPWRRARRDGDRAGRRRARRARRVPTTPPPGGDAPWPASTPVHAAMGVSAVTVGFGFPVDAPPVRAPVDLGPPCRADRPGGRRRPLVVRTVLPVLRAIDPRLREAAATWEPRRCVASQRRRVVSRPVARSHGRVRLRGVAR
jgi:hypothetical protein